ncbi:hypothetical protein [Mesorhizobium onobrychidis]|uniref:Uncharacterized protein n=1 Tax=Mesorhizobium onobrychidis TaxID=2775404 RepID=A0ABY5RA72_9HYPH|nr:hypothetical protein [Mesorhizobium onobrychidis]UVC19289.1 hypothetical protein IHQ72_08905 [Mesorhizobium onobrychidis]
MDHKIGFSDANFTVIDFTVNCWEQSLYSNALDGQKVSTLAIGGTTVLHGMKENAETHAVKSTAK